MSNHSEFIILVGTGHHYGGEGLRVDSMLIHHMKKGGWFTNGFQDNTYWVNDSFDDALLMISLFLVYPMIEKESKIGQLMEKAEQLFKVDLLENGLDTQDKKHISEDAIRELHEDNKVALSDADVKLVVLRLGAKSINQDFDDMKDQFFKAIDSYNLTNIEFCETTFGSFWGGFDSGNPRKIKGKVILDQK
jgi:hypothetical protein